LATDASRQVGRHVGPQRLALLREGVRVDDIENRAAGNLAAQPPGGRSGLNLTYGTPTFGQITSALDPRILQLAMIFKF
jgi:hypothetical protein